MKLRSLHTAGRWLRSRFQRGGLVLLYHRVSSSASGPEDPFDLAVSPERFAEHLRVLREIGRPCPLAELSAEGEANDLRGRTAVTFDDGYADVLENALPELERQDVPATVFVTTGTLDGRFWWEDLSELVRRTPAPSSELEFAVGGQVSHFRLLGDSVEDRAELLRGLHRVLRPLAPVERDPLFEKIVDWSGFEPQGTAVPLDSRGLERLAACPLIEVGAHSVTHRPLGLLDASEQERELRESRSLLEDRLNRPVSSFAYPYGLNSDFTSETVRLARTCGYRRAVTNEPDIVSQASDPMRLGRLWVRDWPAERLRQVLDRWQRP